MTLWHPASEPPERCCRTCKHYDLDAAKDKAGRIHKNWVGRCLWPIPQLPESATLGIRSHVCLVYMPPDGGKACPSWSDLTPPGAPETEKGEK